MLLLSSADALATSLLALPAVCFLPIERLRPEKVDVFGSYYELHSVNSYDVIALTAGERAHRVSEGNGAALIRRVRASEAVIRERLST